MSVVVVDVLEVIGVDEEAAQGLVVAAGPGEFFLEPAIEVAPVMEFGEWIRETADQQALPVDGVFQADTTDFAEMGQKIGGLIAGEAPLVDATQIEAAHQLIPAIEGGYRDALQLPGVEEEAVVLRGEKGAEPGVVEPRVARVDRGQVVDETQVGEGLFAEAVAAEQQADLVARIGQNEMHGVDSEGEQHTLAQLLQEFGQRVGTHQPQLAGEVAFQGRLAALCLAAEVYQLLPQLAVFLFQVHYTMFFQQILNLTASGSCS